MFHNSANYSHTAVRDGININLDCILQELVKQNGMIGHGNTRDRHKISDTLLIVDHPHITASFSYWDPLALVVGEHGDNNTGDYTLLVNGPSASESTLTFSGFTATWMGNIGARYDYDFFKFIAPGTGTYTVEVDPTGSMDPEFVLFDNSGSPLLGTFTDPIDSGGGGTTESRTISLTAGA